MKVALAALMLTVRGSIAVAQTSGDCRDIVQDIADKAVAELRGTKNILYFCETCDSRKVPRVIAIEPRVIHVSSVEVVNSDGSDFVSRLFFRNLAVNGEKHDLANIFVKTADRFTNLGAMVGCVTHRKIRHIDKLTEYYYRLPSGNLAIIYEDYDKSGDVSLKAGWASEVFQRKFQAQSQDVAMTLTDESGCQLNLAKAKDGLGLEIQAVERTGCNFPAWLRGMWGAGMDDL